MCVNWLTAMPSPLPSSLSVFLLHQATIAAGTFVLEPLFFSRLWNRSSIALVSMGVWLNIPSTSDVTSRDNGHSRVTTSLQSLLREPTDESAIKTLTEQLVANSWLRQSRMEYQLDRVEQSLTPGLQARPCRRWLASRPVLVVVGWPPGPSVGSFGS